jgi:integration host factor subunit alpha
MIVEPVTLRRADLVDALGETVGLNRRESAEMVDAFFAEICATLIQAKDVKLARFGNFDVRPKAPRPGRNPRTGELVSIPARSVVRIQASQKLRAAIEHPGRASDAARLSTVAARDN